MTIVVYILSSNDRITSFASHARESQYDTRKVFVGQIKDDVRNVVFLDGSPMALKIAIANGKDAKQLLKELRTRVGNMLKAMRMGYDDLRVVVHFGGQGEDEIKKFNRFFAKETSEMETFKCYAISFENKIPQELFPNGDFTPPHGEALKRMCVALQRGETANFEHLLALRLLLACVQPNQDGLYVVNEIEGTLLSLSGGKSLNCILSTYERRRIMENVKLNEIFQKRIRRWLHKGQKCDLLSLPCNMNYNEYKTLMDELSLKGEQA